MSLRALSDAFLRYGVSLTFIVVLFYDFLYKIYERMILARISPTVEEHLSPDQAGFRPGRSCCGQLLNLTQFKNKQITGAVHCYTLWELYIENKFFIVTQNF